MVVTRKLPGETLYEGHGERSFPAHPVGSNAPALCRGRGSFDRQWLVMVGSDEAEAEHAQSVKVRGQSRPWTHTVSKPVRGVVPTH